MKISLETLFKLVISSTEGMYRPHSFRCNATVCNEYTNLLKDTIGEDNIADPLRFADIRFIEDSKIPDGEIWACDDVSTAGKKKLVVMGKLTGIEVSDTNKSAE